MKKLLLIVVVLLMAAPMYAENEIKFSFVDNWNGTCTITYDVNEVAADPCDDPPVRPVAMGLTLEVVSGNPIKDVACEDENDFMEIFMDAAYSMEIDPCDPCGYTYGAGTPIAKVDAPGETDLVTDGSLFAISMGGLGGELAKTKEPPRHGTITLSADTGATETDVKVYLNSLRGGIIGEDGEPMVAIGLADEPAKNGWARGHVKINECYRESDAVPDWYNVGKPACWCYARQCRGDATGLIEGNALKGFFYVGGSDLITFAANWLVKEPPKGPGVPVCVWTQGTVEIDPRTGQPGSGP